MQTVDDLIPYLENLKLSAFIKADLIKNEINGVTLGPNSTIHKTPERSVTKNPSPEKKIREEPVVKVKGKLPQEFLPIRQIVNEYELERQQQVREAVEGHKKKFERFDAQQAENRKRQWFQQQEKFLRSAHNQEREVMRVLKEYEDNKPKDQDKLILQYKELEEKRKKAAEILEAKKKERELMNECLDCQSRFLTIYQDIITMIKNCQDEKLRAALTPTWKQCKELSEMMTKLISKCKIGVSEANKKTAEIILERITAFKEDISQNFAKLEELKKQKLIKIQQENERINNELKSSSSNYNSSTSNNTVIENTKSAHISNETLKQIDNNSSALLGKFISETNILWYSEVSEFYESYKESFKEILDDYRLKQFRFDCKKAVNLSVNAISAVSSEHLRDKYIKLSNLIRGETVTIGDFRISASQHPKGVPFCVDLLARKFILQGDLMVSSNPEAAFSFATIIVSLWKESPDFGKILLANFFKECPYLVPFYIPKSTEQSDEEHYKNLGYKYSNDGQIEKQDKFLKRMTGIMRLYFSVLISSPKSGQNNENPHNLRVAWTWFVSVLKLEPRVDITSTMIHTFLETVGFEMQNVYKKQFFKLFTCFLVNYFPSLKKIDCSGGPVTRLECLIQDFRENGNRFEHPRGLLPKNFW